LLELDSKASTDVDKMLSIKDEKCLSWATLDLSETFGGSTNPRLSTT
jgi:hypothetical protein